MHHGCCVSSITLLSLHLNFFSVMHLTCLVVSVRTDVCRCNLCWKDEVTLIIGWAKSIKVLDFLSCIPDICLSYVVSRQVSKKI